MNDQPWLHPEAIKKLEEILQKDFKVLEWGAGGSTIWLAQRVGMLVSVEHAPGWAERIARELVARELDWATVVYIPPAVMLPIKSDFDKYADHILEFPPWFFDVAIVDGRDRSRCMENARGRVRRGGWIVLDNATRKEYSRGVALLSDWVRVDVDGMCLGTGPHKNKLFPNQTAFFQKVVP